MQIYHPVDLLFSSQEIQVRNIAIITGISLLCTRFVDGSHEVLDAANRSQPGAEHSIPGLLEGTNGSKEDGSKYPHEREDDGNSTIPMDIQIPGKAKDYREKERQRSCQ